MASTDATPLPIRNQALRITFGLWLTTGLVNSGASGLDSEVSIDGGTYADCTNEATEIATSSGSYYLDITSGEMNGDTIAIQVKSSTTNAITYKITIYPSNAGKMLVAVQTIGGQTASASGPITFPGTIASPTNITAGTITTVTNLTNAASNGDFTSTMKTSLNAATPSVTVSDKTGFILFASQTFSNTGTWTGNLTGSVGSVTGQVTANAAQWGGVNVTGMPMPTYTQPTGFLAANFTTGILVGSFASGLDFTATMKTALNAATPVVTVSDKTGFKLSSDGLAAITAWTVNVTGTVSGNATAAQGAFLDASILSRASAVNLATANASLVRIQAATYDSATLSSSTLTLSNAATMVVSSTGRVTT